MVAHNGEINTIKGNINWMKIHEQDMNNKLFDDIESLKPVIDIWKFRFCCIR